MEEVINDIIDDIMENKNRSTASTIEIQKDIVVDLIENMTSINNKQNQTTIQNNNNNNRNINGRSECSSPHSSSSISLTTTVTPTLNNLSISSTTIAMKKSLKSNSTDTQIDLLKIVNTHKTNASNQQGLTKAHENIENYNISDSMATTDDEDDDEDENALEDALDDTNIVLNVKNLRSIEIRPMSNEKEKKVEKKSEINANSNETSDDDDSSFFFAADNLTNSNEARNKSTNIKKSCSISLNSSTKSSSTSSNTNVSNPNNNFKITNDCHDITISNGEYHGNSSNEDKHSFSDVNEKSLSLIEVKVKSNNHNENKYDSIMTTAAVASAASQATTPTTRAISNNENELDNLRDQMNLIKYELKEKDLDIVQLQKEINELQLENKMLKAKMPLNDDNIMMSLNEDEIDMDSQNPYLKELLAFKREKECVMEELIKAQDTISRLVLEKNSKSIDLYDPNNPEILHKKLKNYEKQLLEFEDENERLVGDLSNLEKIIDSYKFENNELKLKVNECMLYKEQEESLVLEIANLRNDIKKYAQLNIQLSEDNQVLSDELKKISIQAKLKEPTSSTGTQTNQTFSTIHQQEQKQPNEPNGSSLPRHHEYQTFHQQYKNNSNSKLLASSANNNHNSYEQQYHIIRNNISAELIENEYPAESIRIESKTEQKHNRSSSKYDEAKQYKSSMSKKNSHGQHQQNQQNESNQQQQIQNNSHNQSNGSFSYEPQCKNLNLSHTDEYLINNFKPFSSTSNSNATTNTTLNNNSIQTQTPTLSSSSNSRYASASTTITVAASPSYNSNPNHRSSHLTLLNSSNLSNKPPPASSTLNNSQFDSSYQNHHSNLNSTTNYNNNSKQLSLADLNNLSTSYVTSRNKKIHNILLNDEKSTLLDRINQSKIQYNSNYISNCNSNGNFNNVKESSHYSKSNMNLNGSGNFRSNNESDMEQENKDYYCKSTKNYGVSKSSLANYTDTIKSYYSSSEGLHLADPSDLKSSNKNAHSYSSNDSSSSSSNRNLTKSLKINVMRDIKSAQKLKSTLCNSKYSQIASTKEPKNNMTTTTNNYDQNYHKHNNLFTLTKKSLLFDIATNSTNSSSSRNFEHNLLRRSQTFNAHTSKSLYGLNNLGALDEEDHHKNSKLTSSYLNLKSANVNNLYRSKDSFSDSQESDNSESRKFSFSQNEDSDADLEGGKCPFRSKSVDVIEKKDLNRSQSTKETTLIRDITSRKRPFVPIKSDDIRFGDVIKFSRPGGKISKGVVKYIGPLPDRNDVYFGLELDTEEGKHDGIYLDRRYFQTKPNKGVFVSFSKVIMAWG